MAASDSYEFNKSLLLVEDVEWAIISTTTLITPYVYLGNHTASTARGSLQACNIRMVIQIDTAVKTRESHIMYSSTGVRHVQIPVNDTGLLHAYMQQVYDLMRKAVIEKKNILVHDPEGSNAAAAVVVYYVLRQLYDGAVKPTQPILTRLLSSVKVKRDCVNISAHHLAWLESCEKYMRGELGNACPWVR